MKNTKRSLRIIAIIAVLVLSLTCFASAANARTVYWLAGNSPGITCGSHYFSGRQYTIQLGASSAKYNLDVWLSQNGDLKYKKWMSSAISGSYLWKVTTTAGTYIINASNNSSSGYNINFAIS